MVHNIVTLLSSFGGVRGGLHDTVVSRTVNGLVGIGLENATLVFIGPHRSNGRGGILHAVGIIVTRAAAVGEIVYPVFLEYVGCFEEIGNLCIRNEFLFGKAFQVAVQTGYAAAKALVNAPSAKIEIGGTVLIHEGLSVECDGIRHKAVGHQHSICFAQHVLPRTDGRLANSFMQYARLTVEIAVAAVGRLHHIGSPYHFGGGPVHDEVLPVHEVLAHPYLCRSVAIASAVGRGIEVVGIAKFSDGGVGKIAGNKRIARTWCVPERASVLCVGNQEGTQHRYCQ